MVAEPVAPSFVHVYDAVALPEGSTGGLAAFLQQEIRAAAVGVRAGFLRYWLGADGEQERRAPQIAQDLARARVRQPDRPEPDRDPLPGEVDFELRFLTAGGAKPAGLLYDAHRLVVIYSELLTGQQAGPEHCHVVLTNQLFGTWDENDRRYHARVSVYGFPSLISTTGLVHGPARPREFYLGRRIGADTTDLGRALKGRYLEYGDPRLPEAIKGYLLQALFYHVTGDPFCDSKECRLFNAHWQEELIHAQMRPGADLCERHRQMVEKWACK